MFRRIGPLHRGRIRPNESGRAGCRLGGGRGARTATLPKECPSYGLALLKTNRLRNGTATDAALSLRTQSIWDLRELIVLKHGSSGASL